MTELNAKYADAVTRWNHCSDIPLKVWLFDRGSLYNVYTNTDDELRLVFFTDGNRKYVCTRLYDSSTGSMVYTNCSANEDGSLTCSLNAPHFAPGRLHVKVYATSEDEAFSDGKMTLCNATCLPLLITTGPSDDIDPSVEAAISLPYIVVTFYNAAVAQGYTGTSTEFWERILEILGLDAVVTPEDLEELSDMFDDKEDAVDWSKSLYLFRSGDRVDVDIDAIASALGTTTGGGSADFSSIIDSVTGQLKSGLATTVVLASMGSNLDVADGVDREEYTPAIGDTFWDEEKQQMMGYKQTDGTVVYRETISKNLIYCNARTGYLYRYLGAGHWRRVNATGSGVDGLVKFAIVDDWLSDEDNDTVYLKKVASDEQEYVVPNIIMPTDGDSISVGTIADGETSVSVDVDVKAEGIQLLKATISGEGFVLSSTSFDGDADKNINATLTITYDGDAETATGTLTLYDNDSSESCTCTLTASAGNELEVTATPVIVVKETTDEEVVVEATGDGNINLYRRYTDLSARPALVGSGTSPVIHSAARGDAEYSLTFTATAQEEGKDISETASLVVVVPKFIDPYDPVDPGTTDDATPILTSPANSSTLDIGTVALEGESTAESITVKGEHLTEALTVTLGNTAGFSVDKSTISVSDANNGTSIVATYSGTSITDVTCTLTIASSEVSSTMTLVARKEAATTLSTTPVFTVDDTTYADRIIVTASSPVAGAQVFLTRLTDGTNPTEPDHMESTPNPYVIMRPTGFFGFTANFSAVALEDGKEMSETATLAVGVTPYSGTASETAEITQPVNGSTIDLGTASYDANVGKTLTVLGVNITEDVTIAVSDTDKFTVSPTTLTAAEVLAGTAITLTYIGADASAICTLSITSSEVTAEATVVAARNVKTATPTISTSTSDTYVTVTATASEGTATLYRKGVQVANPYNETRDALIAKTINFTATAIADGKLVSDTASLDVVVPVRESSSAITEITGNYNALLRDGSVLMSDGATTHTYDESNPYVLFKDDNGNVGFYVSTETVDAEDGCVKVGDVVTDVPYYGEIVVSNTVKRAESPDFAYLEVMLSAAPYSGTQTISISSALTVEKYVNSAWQTVSELTFDGSTWNVPQEIRVSKTRSTYLAEETGTVVFSNGSIADDTVTTTIHYPKTVFLLKNGAWQDILDGNGDSTGVQYDVASQANTGSSNGTLSVGANDDEGNPCMKFDGLELTLTQMQIDETQVCDIYRKVRCTSSAANRGSYMKIVCSDGSVVTTKVAEGGDLKFPAAKSQTDSRGAAIQTYRLFNPNPGRRHTSDLFSIWMNMQGGGGSFYTYEIGIMFR